MNIEKKINSALIPTRQVDQEPWWSGRHKSILEQIKEKAIDLVFIGDSLTHAWEMEGKAVWLQFHSRRRAINLGFSGDKTENVLWRIENGELNGILPKLVVVLIGTNNQLNTAEEVAVGIIAICNKICEKLPDSKILVMGILPRGQQHSPLRDKNEKTNHILSCVNDGQTVFYADIGQEFMCSDGSISNEVMHDFLHLTSKGYSILANTMEASIRAFLNE